MPILLEKMLRNVGEKKVEEIQLRNDIRNFLLRAIPVLRLSRFKKSAGSGDQDFYELIYPQGPWSDEPVRFEQFPVQEFGPFRHISERDLVAEIIYLATHTEFILDPQMVSQDWKQARRKYDPKKNGEYVFQLNEIFSLKVVWYNDVFDRQIRAIVGPEETLGSQADTLSSPLLW